MSTQLGFIHKLSCIKLLMDGALVAIGSIQPILFKARASFHKEKLFSNVGFGTNLVPKLYASKMCESNWPTSQSTLHSHSTSNYITTLRPLWMNFFSQSNERWARYWMVPIHRARTLLNQSGSSIKYDLFYIKKKWLYLVMDGSHLFIIRTLWCNLFLIFKN